jgi:hypothetical protein
MSKVRPFYWSVRRELWENPAIWVAPLAVEALVLFGYFIFSFHLPHQVAAVASGVKLAKGRRRSRRPSPSPPARCS